MTEQFKLFDVVALTEDLMDIGLAIGQVGTVLEVLAPGIYEVEFSGEDGRTYASTAVNESQLLLLRFRPEIQ